MWGVQAGGKTRVALTLVYMAGYNCEALLPTPWRWRTESLRGAHNGSSVKMLHRLKQASINIRRHVSKHCSHPHHSSVRILRCTPLQQVLPTCKSTYSSSLAHCRSLMTLTFWNTGSDFSIFFSPDRGVAMLPHCSVESLRRRESICA